MRCIVKKHCLIIYFLLSLCCVCIRAAELSKSFLGIILGQNLKDILNSFQLKKIKSDKEYFKKYLVVHLEEQSDIIISIYTFNSKISIIEVLYEKEIFSEADFESIYNQAINLYGLPKKTYTETTNNLINEISMWEDENLFYKLIKTTDYKNNFKSFSITIIDKNTELEVKNLSIIRKFYYKILQRLF